PEVSRAGSRAPGPGSGPVAGGTAAAELWRADDLFRRSGGRTAAGSAEGAGGPVRSRPLCLEPPQCGLLLSADRARDVDSTLAVVRRVAACDAVRGVADVGAHLRHVAADVLDGEGPEPRDMRRRLAGPCDAQHVQAVLAEEHEAGLWAERVDPLARPTPRRGPVARGATVARDAGRRVAHARGRHADHVVRGAVGCEEGRDVDAIDDVPLLILDRDVVLPVEIVRIVARGNHDRNALLLCVVHDRIVGGDLAGE